MDQLMHEINAIIDEGSVNTRNGRAWMSTEIRAKIEHHVEAEREKARSEWDPESDGPRLDVI